MDGYFKAAHVQRTTQGTGAYNVYASGEVKIWCDGVVWMEKGTAKGYLPVKGQFYVRTARQRWLSW